MRLCVVCPSVVPMYGVLAAGPPMCTCMCPCACACVCARVTGSATHFVPSSISLTTTALACSSSGPTTLALRKDIHTHAHMLRSPHARLTSSQALLGAALQVFGTMLSVCTKGYQCTEKANTNYTYVPVVQIWDIDCKDWAWDLHNLQDTRHIAIQQHVEYITTPRLKPCERNTHAHGAAP